MFGGASLQFCISVSLQLMLRASQSSAQGWSCLHAPGV
jgi:hypothetical protein